MTMTMTTTMTRMRTRTMTRRWTAAARRCPTRSGRSKRRTGRTGTRTTGASPASCRARCVVRVACWVHDTMFCHKTSYTRLNGQSY
eukprot:1108073-Prorocentrum_minimum.AAC.1